MRMKNSLLFVLLLIDLSVITNVEAKEQFFGANFSGVYACKGNNNKVGEYDVVATLKLNSNSSHGVFGVYDFSTETENALVYKGQAIANGFKFAMTFNLLDGRSTEYSTGIAEIKKLSNNRWAYTNHYYELDENGGDYGSEYCVMQKSIKHIKFNDKVKKLPSVIPVQH